MTQTTYVCGWDGGGTKTQVLCLTQEGRVAGEGTFGPLNLNGAEEEKIAATIRESVAFMAGQPGGLAGCGALVIGTAGVSNRAAVELVTRAVRQCGYKGPLRLLGDQEIALAGAIDGPGAVLVAGTGAICCGRDGAGNRTRVGGYGYLIDDGGSGYALGRDILTAVVRAADGRGPATALTQAVFAALGVQSVGEIITWLYAPATGKKEVAALAPLLLRSRPGHCPGRGGGVVPAGLHRLAKPEAGARGAGPHREHFAAVSPHSSGRGRAVPGPVSAHEDH